VWDKGKKNTVPRKKSFLSFAKGRFNCSIQRFQNYQKKVEIDSVFSLFLGTIQENNTDKAFFYSLEYEI